MSHRLLWRQVVLLTVGVYSSNHRVLYTIVINGGGWLYLYSFICLSAGVVE